MKAKVEKVNVGTYDYDSIVVNIENKKTEIVFSKKDNISQYECKEVELVKENNIYSIKSVSNSTSKVKNNDWMI